MSKLIAISEAVTIALHGMVLIARHKGETALNVQDIAKATDASKHHVAKVMQRLVKEYYLESQRGPTGGFKLNRKPENISLLNIWEAVEGKIEINKCPLDKHICPFDKCLMDNVANKLSSSFKEYLSKTMLSDYLS